MSNYISVLLYRLFFTGMNMFNMLVNLNKYVLIPAHSCTVCSLPVSVLPAALVVS